MYWNRLSDRLKETYGGKVYKLSLSSGCSCPNRDGTRGSRGCLFCDGAGAFAEAGDISAQLRAAKRRVAAKAGTHPRYIAYFQSFTNTYAPVEVLEPLYTAALAPEDVVALSIATRPDCLPEDIVALLRRCSARKPVWVELGLQTIHPATPQLIRRGYPLPVCDRAVERLKAAGLTVVVHQILGLPGETPEQMVETTRNIGRSGADGIKFHLLHVLRGTDLEQLWRAGQCPVLSLEEYIAVLERCVRALPRQVVIHRLTGDGPKSLLVAPSWSGNKRLVLNTLARRFKERNTWQGRLS